MVEVVELDFANASLQPPKCGRGQLALRNAENATT